MKRVRQYIGILAAAAAYYSVHEGAHLLCAVLMGAFKQIRFMGIGMQIDVYAERMTGGEMVLFCIAGVVATLLTGTVLAALAKKINHIKSKLLRAVVYYIREAVTKLRTEYDSVTLIGNSIGAFFSMNARINTMIRCAYFISPVVDMEQLILNMMTRAKVTEKDLEEKGKIPTSFGEDLSWEYLCYVREHPVCWTVPTRILFGSQDNLTSYETIAAFAKAHGAELTVMEDGEHWFYTEAQMRFLDDWIRSCGGGDLCSH